MVIFYNYEKDCEVDHLYYNAYSFGDRLLEDVYFKVTLKTSGKDKIYDELEPSDFEVEWPSKYDHYTQTLNMDYWTEKALKFCPCLDEGYVSSNWRDGEVGVYNSLEEARKFVVYEE